MAQLAADKKIVDAAKQMKADLEKKHAENRMTLLEMSILMVRFPFPLHREFLLFTLAGRVVAPRCFDSKLASQQEMQVELTIGSEKQQLPEAKQVYQDSLSYFVSAFDAEKRRIVTEEYDPSAGLQRAITGNCGCCCVNDVV